MLSPGIPWMSAQVACHLQVCHEKDTIYYSSNFVMYRKIWCMKWIMEHIVIIKIGKFVNKKNLSIFFSFYTDSWIIIVTPLRTIDITTYKKRTLDITEKHRSICMSLHILISLSLRPRIIQKLSKPSRLSFQSCPWD